LLHGLITLQKRIDAQSIKQVRWYQKEGSETVPVPILGPDIIDPRQYDLIRKVTQERLLEAQESPVGAEESPTTEPA
jgi:NADH-quinone oxidoreductase subunit B